MKTSNLVVFVVITVFAIVFILLLIEHFYSKKQIKYVSPYEDANASYLELIWLFVFYGALFVAKEIFIFFGKVFNKFKKKKKILKVNREGVLTAEDFYNYPVTSESA